MLTGSLFIYLFTYFYSYHVCTKREAERLSTLRLICFWTATQHVSAVRWLLHNKSRHLLRGSISDCISRNTTSFASPLTPACKAEPLWAFGFPGCDRMHFMQVAVLQRKASLFSQPKTMGVMSYLDEYEFNCYFWQLALVLNLFLCTCSYKIQLCMDALCSTVLQLDPV